VVAELIPEFERRNPGIRVEVQQMPWTAAHEKLLTAHVGEATPDIAQMGNSWIPEFHAVKGLEDLSPLVEQSSTLKPENYFPGIWATNVIAGKVYGIPWYVDTRVLFYRTDILASAGWPKPPTTWSEWLRAMEDVKQYLGEGKYPILFPTNEWAQPILLGMQQNSRFLRDGDRYGAFSEPAFALGFNFYVEAFRRGYAPVVSASQVANIYQQFGEGDFAMFITGPWNVGEFSRRLPAGMKDRWNTAPLPAPDGARSPGASLAGGSSLIIFRDSEKKEAAWKLIEFLSEPEQQVKFYELTGDLPARRDAWNHPSLTSDPKFAAFREQLENVQPTPMVPEWEQIVTAVAEHAESAIRGQRTTQEALTALDRRTDQILAKRRWVLEQQ
jgi:multiple sugar transport system substrate-binding protein